VDPFDVEDAADAATAMLVDRDRAAALGMRGRTNVLSTRTWGREEPELLGLYERVLTS
jgi:hypothetical protein